MEAGDNPFIKNRPSTRVSNAPGGNSSLSFGNYVEPGSAQGNSNSNNANDRRQSNAAGNYDSSNKGTRNSSVSQNVGQQGEAREGARAAGNMENNRTTEQTDKRTNVRVNQPPGGASSIIFG